MSVSFHDINLLVEQGEQYKVFGAVPFPDINLLVEQGEQYKVFGAVPFHDINLLVEQGEQYKVFVAVPVTPANTYKVLANKEGSCCCNLNKRFNPKPNTQCPVTTVPRYQPAGGAGRAEQGFHDINMLVEQGEQYKVFGAVPVTPANTYKVLANKEAALLFPGGVREALKKRAKHEATIIPFACIGVDDGFDILVDADEMPSVPVIGPMAVEGVQAWPRVSVTIIGPMAVEGVQSWPRVRHVAPTDRQGSSSRAVCTCEGGGVRRAAVPAEEEGGGSLQPNTLSPPYLPNPTSPPIHTNLHPSTPSRTPFQPGMKHLLTDKAAAAELYAHVKGMKHLLTDKAAAAELYAHVKGEVEGGLQYLLKKREEDPYNDPVPRLLYEATWGGEKQAPTFKP
ncbi:unnamed protein product [Closterium sp. NIES-65]|nr:unnamed protein product [Closterium sp. NIES-65]